MASQINSLSEGTKANITTHFRTYVLFCLFFKLPVLPIVETNLLRFTQYISRNFKAPSSVKNYVYGLQTLCFVKNWSFPDLKHSQFRMLFKGIARNLSHTPSRAHPMSPQLLLNLSEKMDFSSPYHTSMWAVMVCGFYLFCRLSNLLPQFKNFDKSKQLTRSDVFMAQDAVVFQIKWSKVVQTKERVIQTPLKAIPGSILCPKAALVNVCRVSKASSTDHLFAYRGDAGITTITRSEFISFLRQKLSECGIKSSKFSGHSLRRGGATWAFSCGVPTELIKSHGDWRSDAYLLYLQFSLNDKLATTTSMSTH